MDTRGHTRSIPEPTGSGRWGGRPGEPKTQVVVRVIGRVPVAVGGTNVLRFVVPAAAANSAPGHLLGMLPALRLSHPAPTCRAHRHLRGKYGRARMQRWRERRRAQSRCAHSAVQAHAAGADNGNRNPCATAAGGGTHDSQAHRRLDAGRRPRRPRIGSLKTSRVRFRG